MLKINIIFEKIDSSIITNDFQVRILQKILYFLKTFFVDRYRLKNVENHVYSIVIKASFGGVRDDWLRKRT